ncbi:prolyl oligopeptidase family serine peptidase [Nocardioides sp. SLBN-35]|uniref:prolyl oligopeptidase family serine peptidase n=1 Tax=Nocardioides sp. SLBN-35 TaxID=2768445 RepID=UPI00114EEC9F|nr:prolyl oligopeptidase family serine peptidase [Nocardioides sp. SLBN-35]TQK70316.1 prolyl oligopeptidase [Nocardioides sp. SLBN-35]
MATPILERLRGAATGARVVALGEASHNVTELNELRDEALRMLVAEHGFTALVLESGFAEGLAVDAWVRGGPGRVEDVARDAISYGFGHSAVVHRQLSWLRSHGGVRVYGMDVPGGSTSPGPAVRALLARIPAAAGDPDLLRRSDLGGRVEAAVRYAGLSGSARERLLADLRALAARGLAMGDPVAERLAASVLAFADGQDRDRFMADTVRWVLEREERVLVSAHDGHVQRTPYDGLPTLGGLLADALGSDLLLVGTTFASGPAVRITDRSDRPFDWAVALEEGVPGPVLDDDAFDLVLDLGEVHRVPGAFERLRRELAAPYPPTRTVEVVATQAGVSVPDPYRWLEAEDDEVHAWQRRQAEVATGSILGGQDRAALRALVEEYDAGARPVLPRHAAGRWFRPVGSSVVVADEPYGAGVPVVVLEAGALLSWLAPSPDGRVLAIGVCADGSEHNTIRLVDVASGERLPAPPQVLHSAWAGGVSWAADSTGFWFFALTGTPEEFVQATFHHELATGATVVEPVPVPAGSREYTLVQPSPDGRWLVASHRVGSPIPVAVRDLASPQASWRPFVTSCTGTVAGHVVGDRYVAVTDVGAARGRLVAIPLDAASPDDVSCWEELVAEGPTVLRSVTPVGEHLYLSELDRTFARVRVLERCGGAVGDVPLPGRGALAAPFFALTGLAAGGPTPDFLFAFSTPTTSWSVHRHRAGAADVETLLAPVVTLDAVLEEGAAPAADGTLVPFHVIRPTDGDAAPAPTLVTAYGAANVPTLPSYQPDLAAFVAAGGTVVQAYLRGGGELGRDWYLAAHRETKHVRDDDLVAVAEHLVASGRTTPDRLALTGGSDGGLMCGVAVTTRPDLWRAVLPRAPLLDLVAGMRDPYLDFVIRKAWGDPDDPADVRRMIGRSPYELIGPGTFPAVYVQAGATDPRCRPWHARKFVARLQAAQEGDAPILLHVFEDAGHGAATSPEVVVAQDVEWLGFLVQQLGLSPEQ